MPGDGDVASQSREEAFIEGAALAIRGAALTAAGELTTTGMPLSVEIARVDAAFGAKVADCIGAWEEDEVFYAPEDDCIIRAPLAAADPILPLAACTEPP